MFSYEANSVAIENLLYDIALESENDNKQPGKFQMMLANLCKKASIRCKKNSENAKAKNHQRFYSFWDSLYRWFDSVYKKLSGSRPLTDAELNTTKTNVEQKTAQVKAAEQKQSVQEKQAEKSLPREQKQNQNDQNDFTHTDGDLTNGRPKKSRKKADVVREYRHKARLCRERGDEKGYELNMKLSNDAAMDPNLNSLMYYDPNLEKALEEFLGYELYRYTITNGPEYITNVGFATSESYLYDAMEYEAVFESLFDDEDDYDDDFYDDDDYDEYDCGLESLLA